MVLDGVGYWVVMSVIAAVIAPYPNFQTFRQPGCLPGNWADLISVLICQHYHDSRSLMLSSQRIWLGSRKLVICLSAAASVCSWPSESQVWPWSKQCTWLVWSAHDAISEADEGWEEQCDHQFIQKHQSRLAVRFIERHYTMECISIGSKWWNVCCYTKAGNRGWHCCTAAESLRLLEKPIADLYDHLLAHNYPMVVVLLK